MVTIVKPQLADSHTPDPSPLEAVDLAPPWRPGTLERPDGEKPGARAMSREQARKGSTYRLTRDEAAMVDAAFALRRPILVQGPVGVGKSSLAYAVAWQLGLGDVLHWGITSRTTHQEGLYQYDAIARLNAVALFEKQGGIHPRLNEFLRLGPLGTALAPTNASHYFPRVLLIDEIDKCDADLPSDLLHVFELGWFEIREIARLEDSEKHSNFYRTADRSDVASSVQIPEDGIVRCDDFPLIIMTSNRERDFSPAFRRRCLVLEMEAPDEARLLDIARAHLGDRWKAAHGELVADHIKAFADTLRKNPGQHSTDQLLNAMMLRLALDLDVRDSDRRAMHKLQDPGDTSA